MLRKYANDILSLLQIALGAPITKEDLEDQRKAEEEVKLQTRGVQAIMIKRRHVSEMKRKCKICLR